MPTPADAATAAPAADRRTLWWGLAGAVVTYLAHPPVGWWWCAWIGPAAWIYLVALPKLPGRRPYGTLWLAGLVHWLLTIAWLRLPHPANWGALVFVTSYLGLYLPTFVGLSRVAVHRLRWPLWLAAPIVWTGLELARAHLLTGFVMGSLASSQWLHPRLLWPSSVGGEYAVTYLIVFAASLPLSALTVARWRDNPMRMQLSISFRSAGALALIAYVYAQGAALEAAVLSDTMSDQPVRIALVQSDLLALWKGDDRRDADVMDQQVKLSRRAVRAAKGTLDLIVWPETMFRLPLHEKAPGYELPKGLFHPDAETVFAGARDYLAELTAELGTPVLVGIDREYWHEPPPGAEPLVEGVPPVGNIPHNAVACVNRDGVILGTYDKMHLLPFGEYVPLVDWIPPLRWITPITGMAEPGEGPVAFALPAAADPGRTVRYAPNICYETALPHLIREQVHELAERGEAPDVLVNVTNDAWYWGSAELDMHLASGVLRAVETRTPLVVAANRGLSAHIDELGQIVAATERDCADVLTAEVTILGREKRVRQTFYVRYGDWLPGACLVCCIVFAGIGWRDSRAAGAGMAKSEGRNPKQTRKAKGRNR